MDRIDLFVQHWCNKASMTAILVQDIIELEDKLTIKFPETYRYLVSTYGLVHTPNVLTKTCDLNVNVAEVNDFLSLDDIYSLTKLYEMTGLPKGYVLFASDCQGNMFCFKLIDNVTQVDASVWFFNYSLGTVTHVADTFTEWLNNFNR